MFARYQRASSVQRQTDTLRRLGQQRDVAQRLQTPAPSMQQSAAAGGGRGPGGIIVANPNFMGYTDDGGPVLLLSDDGGRTTEDGNASFGGGDAGLMGRRPVPPPYLGAANVRHEEDGTYLV
jgi:hypothetical protein